MILPPEFSPKIPSSVQLLPATQVVENTVEGLERFGCCSIEEDVDLAPANLGLIAAYYYIRHTTIETFSRLVGWWVAGGGVSGEWWAGWRCDE